MRYHTLPPEQPKSQILSSELVQTFAKEFDLDALDGDIKILIEGIFGNNLSFIKFSAIPNNEMIVETVYDSTIELNNKQNEGEKMMEHDGTTSKIVVLGKKPKKVGDLEPLNTNSFFPNSLEIDGNVQIETAIKKAVKKHKKLKRKMGKLFFVKEKFLIESLIT